MRRHVHRCAACFLLSMLGGCISVARPGHYSVPDIGDLAAKPATRLTVALRPWKLPTAQPGVTARLGGAFVRHLRRARLFAVVRPGAGKKTQREPDLELQGSVDSVCQPITVFSKAPLQCRMLRSFGYSGMQLPLAAGTLGLWPATVIFGVPTDWGQARVRLSLTARDPRSGVQLRRWTSGVITARAYAGLYYSGSPLAKTLRIAATKLIENLARDAPALQRRIVALRTWHRRYGLAASELRRASAAPRLRQALADRDPAVRCCALQAIAAIGPPASAAEPAVVARASDDDPQVRYHVARTLAALRVHDRPALAALTLLTRDRAPEVRAAGRDALAPARVRALAGQASQPRVADLLLRLAAARQPHRQRRLLEALAVLGTNGREAQPAVLLLLQRSRDADVRRAAVAALVAFDALDRDAERALRGMARSGGSLGRSARLALLQLRHDNSQRVTSDDRAHAASAPAPPAGQAVAQPPAPRDRPVVAVFNPEGGRLSPQLRRALAELLAAHLTATAGFRVVPSEQLRSRLKRSKRQSYRACYDQRCQIEIGKAVAAEKVAATKINRSGKSCVLTTTLYDLRSETTDGAAVVRTSCRRAAIEGAMQTIAARLARR